MSWGDLVYKSKTIGHSTPASWTASVVRLSGLYTDAYEEMELGKKIIDASLKCIPACRPTTRLAADATTEPAFVLASRRHCFQRTCRRSHL